MTTKPSLPPAVDIDGPPPAPAKVPDAIKPSSADDKLVKPAVTTKAPEKVEPAAKLRMLVRIGTGAPRFEIRGNGSDEVVLKVHGEKIEMQSAGDASKRTSLRGVTATGGVRFAGPGVSGTCDHLSILSDTGEVLLRGNVRMKSKTGKGWSEMTADKMVYQIGAAGLVAPGTPRPTVTPASYIPD